MESRRRDNEGMMNERMKLEGAWLQEKKKGKGMKPKRARGERTSARHESFRLSDGFQLLLLHPPRACYIHSMLSFIFNCILLLFARMELTSHRSKCRFPSALPPANMLVAAKDANRVAD